MAYSDAESISGNQNGNSNHKSCKSLLVTLAYLPSSLLSRSSSEATEWRQNIPHLSHNGINDKDLAHIQNETLSFEHIYAIGMKGRTDKRDFLDVAASVTGFRVDWLEGVRPDELKQKAMPNGFTISATKPGIAACWRGTHECIGQVRAILSRYKSSFTEQKLILNPFKIVENSYSSALIFEDGADWDVNIKLQLHEFARGLHPLQGNEKVSPEHPYGTDWNVLWIGGCGSAPKNNETQFYAIPNDPTLPSHQHRAWDLGGPLDSWREQFPKTPHALHSAQRRFAAYMVMLYCAEAWLDVDRLTALPLSPKLIGTYRKAGPASKDSEIESYDENEFHEEASNYVMCTRRNIHPLVAGEETVCAQWDDVPWADAQINPKDLIYAQGFLVN
ncbi:uncharacterized protein N7477_000656 [Penicillium maclennaniae]|uniref:uncharacterized protein n=1 Tax=Penicillium maclennaniae TaxID=1343394 RepID=UPI002540B15C|nr:uncharacterized protein N7477_000656 [Penicillium maclennaniae]KAJ5684311.1 hypothetical protein N7477_000656 [Penicillium maclennaniae]